MERAFMSPVGPWFRWFAWHPVRTDDRGWRWLRPLWRRRMQTHDYLDGPVLTDWRCLVDNGEPDPEEARRHARGNVLNALMLGGYAAEAGKIRAVVMPVIYRILDGDLGLAPLPTAVAEAETCPRCDSDTCPGRADILDCTTLIAGLSARAQARHLLDLACCLRCLDCGAPAISTNDGGWCTQCRTHVAVTTVTT